MVPVLKKLQCGREYAHTLNNTKKDHRTADQQARMIDKAEPSFPEPYSFTSRLLLCVECVQEEFLSCLGAEMDHLLACDCFTHGPGLLLIFLRLTFLFFSILKLAQQPTNTKQNVCSRHCSWPGGCGLS